MISMQNPAHYAS